MGTTASGFDSSRRCKRADGPLVLRYLVPRQVPVIACVRSGIALSPNRRWHLPKLVLANVAATTLAPLMERAAHVIYLAGGDRRGLSPGAWQLEIDACQAASTRQRAGLPVDGFRLGYS